jgi:hypothetical protein
MKRWLGALLLAAATQAWGVAAETDAATDAAARIKAVLDADAKIEAEAAATVGGEPKAPDAGQAKTIVAKMKAIDLAGCPEDFRDAYLKHIDAWNRYVLFADGLTEKARGDPMLQTKLGEIVAAIDSTFDAVRDAARRHGVEPPRDETAAPAP